MVRAAAVACLLGLSACSLYFGSGSGDDDHGGGDDVMIDAPPNPVPDASPLPDAPSPATYLAYCGGGGVIYRDAPATLSDDMFNHGDAIGMCPNGCAIDSTYARCGDAGCTGIDSVLCAAPLACPETGQTCQGEGTTSRCALQVGCAVSAAVRTCTCTNGAYQCRPACTGDQSLCGPAGVGDAMGGTWRGTVTPPSFAMPYQASVIFKPDRTYVSQSPGERAAFYYGKDGTSRVYRWRPIGVAPGGGVATVDVYFGFESIRTGLATDIQRQGDRLRFTFWDSWLDCSRPFAFDLTLAP